LPGKRFDLTETAAQRLTPGGIPIRTPRGSAGLRYRSRLRVYLRPISAPSADSRQSPVQRREVHAPRGHVGLSAAAHRADRYPAFDKGQRHWNLGSRFKAHRKPFEQADNVYSRGNEGTGLGLALVRSFAQLHGRHDEYRDPNWARVLSARRSANAIKARSRSLCNGA